MIRKNRLRQLQSKKPPKLSELAWEIAELEANDDGLSPREEAELAVLRTRHGELTHQARVLAIMAGGEVERIPAQARWRYESLLVEERVMLGYLLELTPGSPDFVATAMRLNDARERQRTLLHRLGITADETHGGIADRQELERVNAEIGEVEQEIFEPGGIPRVSGDSLPGRRLDHLISERDELLYELRPWWAA